MLMGKTIRITVWNEYLHEKQHEEVRKVYPDGIHRVVADGLLAAGAGAGANGFEVREAWLDQPEHGLTEDVLEQTDVLFWWAHMGHGKVADEIAERVQKRVLDGMGMVFLHSAHFSKPFKKLMGTGCDLKWRESGEKERLWVVDPAHPIVDGLGEYIELPHTEMYGEHFDIPQPDELVFISWFAGGEVFRSGCCWHRGKGKIFYFRPGHETYPIYYNDQVRHVLANAARWAAPSGVKSIVRGNYKPLEKLD